MVGAISQHKAQSRASAWQLCNDSKLLDVDTMMSLFVAEFSAESGRFKLEIQESGASDDDHMIQSEEINSSSMAQ